MIKILEKEILKSLKQEKELVNNRQKGFTPKMSTHQNIREAIEIIQYHKNQNKYKGDTYVLFIDF